MARSFPHFPLHFFPRRGGEFSASGLDPGHTFSASDLHAALRDEHVGLVKDLLKAVVSKVEIRFKTEREGRRYVSRIEKGVLELNGVAGSKGGSYSPYNSGGPIWYGLKLRVEFTQLELAMA